MTFLIKNVVEDNLKNKGEQRKGKKIYITDNPKLRINPESMMEFIFLEVKVEL